MDSNVILGLLAIIIPMMGVYIAYQQSRKKELSCYYETYPVVSVNPQKKSGVKEDLEIYYKGRRIHELYVTYLTLEHSGRNISILEEDFTKPLYIKFKNNPHILSAEVLDTDPDGINVTQLEYNEDSITLKFDLMNPGDAIKLKVLSEKKIKSSPMIISRIKGLTKESIKVYPKNEIDKIRQQAAIFFAYVILFLIVLVGDVYSKFRQTGSLIVSIVDVMSNNIKGFLVMGILLIVGIIFSKKPQWIFRIKQIIKHVKGGKNK